MGAGDTEALICRWQKEGGLFGRKEAAAELNAIVVRGVSDPPATPADTEVYAIMEAVDAALDGKLVSDFMESFPIVRKALDLRASQGGVPPAGQGTPAARLDWFANELEKRWIDPEPLSAQAFEPRFLAWLDGLLAGPQAGWRPIETAPKDSRDVLLIGRGGFPDVGRWFDCGINEPGFFAVHAIRWEPTHWMPLPAAPDVRPDTP
jgi:hypothetical protein